MRLLPSPLWARTSLLSWPWSLWCLSRQRILPKTLICFSSHEPCDSRLRLFVAKRDVVSRVWRLSSLLFCLPASICVLQGEALLVPSRFAWCSSSLPEPLIKPGEWERVEGMWACRWKPHHSDTGGGKEEGIGKPLPSAALAVWHCECRGIGATI